MAHKMMFFEDSPSLCTWVADQDKRVLLSFSGGKDSIGSWLQMRRHFDEIVPFFMYIVPDLEFQEVAIQYYEKAFGTKIWRLPHPALYAFWNTGTMQAPQNIQVIYDANLREYSYGDVANVVIDHLELPMETYTGKGVRARDSLARWASIKQYGAISVARQTFFPIFDWTKQTLVDEIRASGIKLSADYKHFGRSFDGLDWRFTHLIKQHYPRDWDRMVECFPLLEADLWQIEFRKRYFEGRTPTV